MVAAKYEVPANIALRWWRRKAAGQWVRNSNETCDVGPMRFNTAYLSDRAKYGITAIHVAQAGCYALIWPHELEYGSCGFKYAEFEP